MSAKRVVVREVGPDDWPAIERLFGPKGACGGCWCMYWRMPRGGRVWQERTGATNKRSFKRLVQAGEVHGCLAWSGDEPVGWCAVGPRTEFPRLERSKALRTEWDAGTWSVTCFYIPAAWRRQGVGSALLSGAAALARRHGARRLEGYPVYNRKNPLAMYPATFAWTGVPAMFRKARFKEMTEPGVVRPIWRRDFR